MNKDHQPQEKSWWGAVWRGLVVDPDAKHYRQMRNASFLFLYLIIHADRRTGELRRKHSTIAADTGLAERTIRRWLARPRKYNYLVITRTGRSHVIHIQKWKTIKATTKTD